MAYRESFARRMIAAGLLSDLGNQIVHLALLSAMFFQLTDATTNLFFLSLIQQLPALLLGPCTGSQVDRMGPRAGLLCGSLAKLVLVLGLLFFRDRIAVWGIYLLFMIASLIFLISRLSMTPCIVARDRLIAYNTLNEKVTLGASILGPSLIGLLILHVGTDIVLSGSAAMYGVSALLIRGLPTLREPVVKQVVDCFAGWSRCMVWTYLNPLKNLQAGIWMAVSAMAVGIGGVLNFGAPVYNHFFFGGDILSWGTLMSGYQTGAYLAALLLPVSVARWHDSAICKICFSLVTMEFALLSVFPCRLLFVLTMIGFGWGFTMLQILTESRIQRDCPAPRRGTTMAALSSLRGAGLVAGLILGSGFTVLAGVRAAMIAGALASATGLGMVILFSTVFGKKRRRYTR